MKKNIYTFSWILLFVIVAILFTQTSVANAANCGGVNTSLLNCPTGNTNTLGGVGEILKLGVELLRWIVLTVAVAAITYAGILYATAAGNADQIKKSMSYIRNAIIGLIAYYVMRALLVWLVPGFNATIL